MVGNNFKYRARRPNTQWSAKRALSSLLLSNGGHRTPRLLPSQLLPSRQDAAHNPPRVTQIRCQLRSLRWKHRDPASYGEERKRFPGHMPSSQRNVADEWGLGQNRPERRRWGHAPLRRRRPLHLRHGWPLYCIAPLYSYFNFLNSIWFDLIFFVLHFSLNVGEVIWKV